MWRCYGDWQVPVKGWEWSRWLGDVSLGLCGLRPRIVISQLWLPRRGPQTGRLQQQASVVSVLEAGDQIIGRAGSFWGFSPWLEDPSPCILTWLSLCECLCKQTLPPGLGRRAASASREGDAGSREGCWVCHWADAHCALHVLALGTQHPCPDAAGSSKVLSTS